MIRPLIPVFALFGSVPAHALQFKAIHWLPDTLISVLPALESVAITTDFSDVTMTVFGLQVHDWINTEKGAMDGSWESKGLWTSSRFYGETSLFYYHLGENHTYDPVASSGLYVAHWPKRRMTMSQEAQLWKLPQARLAR